MTCLNRIAVAVMEKSSIAQKASHTGRAEENAVAHRSGDAPRPRSHINEITTVTRSGTRNTSSTKSISLSYNQMIIEDQVAERRQNSQHSSHAA